MLTRLAKLASINWLELFVAYLYLLLAWWKLSIRKEDLDRWVLADPRPLDEDPNADDEERLSLSRRGRWINLAARYPFRWALCLQRSLALCLWLERRGVVCQLRIGVRKRAGVLEAHAWVEYHGCVLNDSQSVSRRFALMNVQG